MCSGCSINIYGPIEGLIFLSPLSLVLAFFSLQTGYVLALEAQLVTKDNEMTPKSPTCFYSCG